MSWTRIMLTFGIITANAQLFEDFIWIHLGLTVPDIIMSSIPRYLFISRLIWHYDEKIGFCQVKNNLIYRFSPYSDEMRKDILEIKQQLRKET